MRKFVILSALMTWFGAPAAGQIDARMFRYPDVSATQITFVYAGDIWVAPKAGGAASRLSSPPGEEMFPRFSPDGASIAFSGNYDGNLDVYVLPSAGGQPTRITHHPMPDRIVDWDPDGETLLYASSMMSGKQRFNQFYRVDSNGGLATRLPMVHAEHGAISPDGSALAFTMKDRDFRTWKRYRGGTAPDIHIFDLGNNASENLTDHPANDGTPMWYGDLLYFLSDRGPNQRFNIWVREASGTVRQVTDFSGFDITFPAVGPSEIVFQAGGRLHLLDLATESVREVEVDVVTDLATLKPRIENVASLISGGGISATGQRAVFEARGEIFTVPAENGPIRNLTQTPGIAERHPSWSPDGQQVAYWSDTSGEYELTVRAADGSGSPRELTSLGSGFRYTPVWSPDSKKAAFMDQLGMIRIVEISSGAVTEVQGTSTFLSHGPASTFPLSWSSDSRWLAYAFPVLTVGSSVYLHDTAENETHQVTSGYYADAAPTFDPDGKYLYLLTNRHLQPVYSDLQGTWIYPNTTQVAVIPLREDVPSPLAPRNDEEEKGAEEEGDEEGDVAETDDVEPVVDIDLGGFERRLVVLPIEPGNYGGLAGASGKVVYRRQVRAGGVPGGPTPIAFWNLEDRKEETVMENAAGFQLSSDGEKVLVNTGGRFGIVSLAPGQTLSTPLRTPELESLVDPRAEWRQIFLDVWRMERDYFYDGQMHGLDWEAIRDQYQPLIEDAVTRWDVNFVIGEMIAEMDASHTYRGGGDLQQPPARPVGLLGVDWALENGAYRIAHIVRGDPWDNEVRSPLDQPGVDVNEGDFVLAINGIPLDATLDPWAAFQGLAGKTVTLSVSADPGGAEVREVLVETLTDETRLRHLEWIGNNRRMVDELSEGRVGYVYVPDTGLEGQTELVRQFAAQFTKDALVIDERFNSGGQIPDRFIELLNRPALSFWKARTGADVSFPPVSHQGPKVMLINGWSGSGGDAFPYFFREAGLGPLIGTRTWGGLIGYSGNPALIDGGGFTVPTFRMYSTDGEWFPEGHGVEPDIEIPEDATALAAGRDPQIEGAVAELIRMLEEDPFVKPARPAPENRSRRRGGGGGR